MSSCPICGKRAESSARPFCSNRCADIDLARWLGGNYRISSPLTDEDLENLPSEQKKSE